MLGNPWRFSKKLWCVPEPCLGKPGLFNRRYVSYQWFIAPKNVCSSDQDLSILEVQASLHFNECEQGMIFTTITDQDNRVLALVNLTPDTQFHSLFGF